MTGALRPALATTAAFPKVTYTYWAAMWSGVHAVSDRLFRATASSTNAPESRHSNDNCRNV